MRNQSKELKNKIESQDRNAVKLAVAVSCHFFFRKEFKMSSECKLPIRYQSYPRLQLD